MNHTIVLSFLVLLLLNLGEAGTPCPNMRNTLPCFCSYFQDSTTLVICPAIQNSTHLELVTKSLKSQIVDHLILLNTFQNVSDWQENEIIPEPPTNKLPVKWLAEMRVRELEILNGNLHSCFLCDDALEGQADFLTSLIVKQSKLRGHLCSTCTTGDTSVSTRELRRTPKLRSIDLSFNEIEVLDGVAFPPVLVELTKLVLSNNKINKIHDSAFQSLSKLTELDLSRNRLTVINRKIFKTTEAYLKILDLSYNSILTLPDDFFKDLRGLREIKVANNLFQTLPKTTWSRIPANTEKIDAKGNFLVCNCNMSWIRQFGRNTKISGHCVLPKEVEFQDLKGDLPPFVAGC